jgi:hypothetical protein
MVRREVVAMSRSHEALRAIARLHQIIFVHDLRHSELAEEGA